MKKTKKPTKRVTNRQILESVEAIRRGLVENNRRLAEANRLGDAESRHGNAAYSVDSGEPSVEIRLERLRANRQPPPLDPDEVDAAWRSIFESVAASHAVRKKTRLTPS